MQACNMSSRISMVCSDCPSVWGWYEVLNFRRVPWFSWRLSQKCDQNLTSLSDTMLTGTPCKQTISLIYLSARTSVNWPTLNGRKWVDFVRRSMTTHTILLPLGLQGRAVTNPQWYVPTSIWVSVMVVEIQLFSDILSLFAGKPSILPHIRLSLSS